MKISWNELTVHAGQNKDFLNSGLQADTCSHGLQYRATIVLEHIRKQGADVQLRDVPLRSEGR